MVEFLQTWLAGVLTFVLSALACTFFEIFAAVEKQSWLSRARALVFWAIFLAATTAIVMPVQAAVRSAGIEPLISIDLRAAVEAQHWSIAIIAYALLPFAPYLLFDCFYYWFHRLQHAVPLLWRFHAVHHAIEELNAANCYHHVTEGLFRIPFVILPLMLVVQLHVPDVLIMTATLAAWAQFVHANTYISFGRFDRLLASPRFHRVHHSMAPEHRDKNFASFFPLFDVLFRTAYFPRSGEVIKTGLVDKQEARTLGQYLLCLAAREPAGETVHRTEDVPVRRRSEIPMDISQPQSQPRT